MDDLQVKTLTGQMLNEPEKRKAGYDISDLILSLREASDRKFLTKEELTRICILKSPRRAALSIENNDGAVERVTRFAFSEPDPLLKIRVLGVLNGVSVPTASAILAWTYPEKFPVIDRRAWRALADRAILPKRNDEQSLTIGNWLTYLGVIRRLEKYTGWKPQEIDHWLYLADKEKRAS